MTQNKEGFSFELEEVLSFERGQEVGEMISVFLDPDITVQSLEEDISIRGKIELQGEYERVKEQMDSEERLLRADSFELRNYVDKVVDIGEERAIFNHQFPVEISIPHYRVATMDDVSMEIEHFDYEIIAPDEMKVQSLIMIRGVNNEERVDLPVGEDDEKEALFSIIEQDGEELATENERETILSTEEQTLPEEMQGSAEIVPELEKLDRKMETGDEGEDEVEDLIIEEPVEVLERSQKETETIIAAKDPEDVEETEGTEHRNIDYLTSMFGEEEDSRHSQVRLCIVQERDTVDSIAERYDIKKTVILQKNQLEDEELTEGQLLRIPFSSN